MSLQTFRISRKHCQATLTSATLRGYYQHRKNIFRILQYFIRELSNLERATLEEKDDRNRGDYMYRRKEYLGPEL